MKSNRQPITGEYAKAFRDQVRRYETGDLNEEDKKRIEFLESPIEYNITWR